MEALEDWIARQERRSIAGMLMSVSPVDLVKARPGFGQTVQARRGAIVASPVLAAYDPDPDYFFHWYRDSAVVVDALRLLHAEGRLGEAALTHLADFVDFSRALQGLDGRALNAASSWRDRVRPDFTQYLRSPAELATVNGDAVAADTRVNPDGTLDISRWTRPQHDGPPLRALALLRWLREPAASAARDGALGERIAALVHDDLAFTRARWNTPSFDIWEEESGLHYYTLRMSAAALEAGAAWRAAHGDADSANALRAEAGRILRLLDGYWLEEQGHYRSRVLADGTRSAKELDIAVILAAIHSDDDLAAVAPAAADAPGPARDEAPAGGGPRHGPGDPRLHASLARLDAVFDAQYAINRGRPAQRAPAMGRYAGDVYYSGGAYYFSTLGAAEFCFRAALRSTAPRTWTARGEAYLETVRAHTPGNGDLSEQFDQRTGEQTSARHLAWSYAAFLTCAAARRRAAAAAAAAA
jgi:glucoamylase